MVDFAEALKVLGFNLDDVEHYTLDKLTLNRYMLRSKKTNPRFSGSVGFAVVDSIPIDAAPDIDMYKDRDFTHTDNEEIMLAKNFATYQFCFTKENSMVVKCVQDSDEPEKAVAVINIDRHAHFVENIGLVKPMPRYHSTTITVVRKLPAEIYSQFGFQMAFPLGLIDRPKTSWDLIDRINELYDLGITKSDIIDLKIHENLHAVRFKSSCLAYTGEILVDISGRV